MPSTASLSPRLRVVVADDQELVRSGLAVIVDAEDDLDVVGEAADGEEAVALAERCRPDVILMDIRMPRMDGLEATRRIAGAQGAGHAGPRIVILTTFDLDEYVYAGLRAGATGFLLKDAPRQDLLAAIRAAAAGDSLLSPSVTRRLVEHFSRSAPEPELHGHCDPLAPLTARERDVMLAMAHGLSNGEIARAQFVSEATVKTHVGHLLAKLGLRDRVQAVILAYECGLVVPGQPPSEPAGASWS